MLAQHFYFFTECDKIECDIHTLIVDCYVCKMTKMRTLAVTESTHTHLLSAQRRINCKYFYDIPPASIPWNVSFYSIKMTKKNLLDHRVSCGKINCKKIYARKNSCHFWTPTTKLTSINRDKIFPQENSHQRNENVQSPVP